MANYINFIDVEYIKLNTLADCNIEADILNKVIKKSQDIDIQSALGSSLYQSLMDDLVTNSTPSNNYFLALIEEHVQPIQAMYCYMRLLTADHVKMTNKGMLIKTPDGSTSVDYSVLNSLKQTEKNDIEFYLERMRSYILNNINFFTPFMAYSGIDKVYPSSPFDDGGFSGPGSAGSNSCGWL